MKKILTKRNPDPKGLICAALLLLSLVLTLIKVKGYNLTDTTISAIGRKEPLWFFLWGTLTSVTVLCNLLYICNRLNVNNGVTTLAVVTCAFSFFLPVLYLGTDTLERIVHGLGVLIFGVIGYLVMMGCFCRHAKENRKKKSMLYFSMLLGVLVSALLCFVLYGFTGMTEVILLLGAETILFLFDLFFH